MKDELHRISKEVIVACYKVGIITKCWQENQEKSRRTSVEISGPHVGEYEDDCFWNVSPCSGPEIGRRFRCANCLHYQGNDMMTAVSTFEMSVNLCETTRRNAPWTVILTKDLTKSGDSSHSD
jgi:hypothetical protein